MTTAKLTFSKLRNDVVASKPKLGSFVHGQLKEREVKFDNFRMFEHSKNQKKQIIALETDEMGYVGRNFGEESYENDFQKTYLGAYDPDTEEMEVFDVAMFKFRPYIPEIEKESLTNSSEMPLAEQYNLLTSAFGSKRTRKAMETKKKNLVEEETLKKVLDSTVQENKEKAVERLQHLDDMVKAEESQMSLLPPCNRETRKVEEIFKLSDIISDFDMELLKTPAEVFYNAESSTIKEWTTENKYPLIVIRHLHSLPTREEDRWHKCKCLVYLCYLIYMSKMLAKKVCSYKDPFPEEWPVAIKKRLLAAFTGPPPSLPAGDQRMAYRSYPKPYQDRVALYTMTLALILDSYVLKLTDMMRDMKIGKVKILQYARMLGCKCMSSRTVDDSSRAELKAPFTIAKSRPPKGKK